MDDGCCGCEMGTFRRGGGGNGGCDCDGGCWECGSSMKGPPPVVVVVPPPSSTESPPPPPLVVVNPLITLLPAAPAPAPVPAPPAGPTPPMVGTIFPLAIFFLSFFIQ